MSLIRLRPWTPPSKRRWRARKCWCGIRVSKKNLEKTFVQQGLSVVRHTRGGVTQNRALVVALATSFQRRRPRSEKDGPALKPPQGRSRTWNKNGRSYRAKPESYIFVAVRCRARGRHIDISYLSAF